jgi:hypothetical protein
MPTSYSIRRVTRYALAAAVMFALAGCGSDADKPQQAPRAPASNGPAASQDPNGSTPVEAPPASESPAAAAPPQPGKVLGEGDFPHTNEFADGSAHLRVLSLARDPGGRTVTLTFEVTNNSDSAMGLAMGAEEGTASDVDVGGIYLVDPVNAKKHLVVRDSAGACVCSQPVPLPSGGTGQYSATFPAPPQGVTTMSVTIPHLRSFTNVPLS